jgi:hypothetical protein
MRTTVAASSNNGTLQQTLEPENSRASAAHTVLFYKDDAELLDTLAQSVCAAVTAGNSAIVIATADHHDALFARLKGLCSEAYDAILEARLFLLDAEETIARFMLDGQPDPALFADVLGANINQLVANARGENPSVFVFGEMGPLLWEQGNHAAALRLEQFGNQLLASCPANILCAYSTRLFPDGTQPHPAAEICALHSCVISPKNPSCSFP